MGLFDIFKKKSAEAPKTNSPSSTTFSTPSISFGNDPVPVEKRIKQLSPLYGDLYAHEILVLHYAPTYSPGENSFQGFWWYQYGVKDPSAILKSLEKRGYIAEGGPETAVKSSKAGDLKEFLKANGLKVSGKKDELVARVLSECDPSEVAKAFTETKYQLTGKGEIVAEACAAVLEAHRDPIKDITIWDINQKALTNPNAFRDERWSKLNKEYLDHCTKGDFGLARNVQLQMAEFLEQENRYKDSIKTLCMVMTYDLSGAKNSFNPSTFFKVTAKYLFPYEGSLATIAPGIAKNALALKEKASMSDEEFDKLVLDSFTKYYNIAPFQLFDPEECVTVFKMTAAKDDAGLTKMYKLAEKRFYEQYPEAAK